MTRYPKYKQTGISWLPEIPEEWEIHRIKNHYVVVSGSGFKPDLQGVKEGDYPVCKASDISSAGKNLTSAANWISAEVARSEGFHIMPAGSLLFPKIGEAMRKNSRTLAMVDCCADNNCQALIPRRIDNCYTYYLFTQVNMIWFDNAGPVPCISNKKLMGFSIPYPSIDEQRRIGNFLDNKCGKIDKVVAAKESQIELLKELKQTEIADAVTRGIAGASLVNSGIPWLPKIPKGWEVKHLRELLKMVSRKGYQNKQLLSVTRESGVIIRNCDSKEENHNFIPEDLSNYKLVEVGDFAINKMKSWQGSYGVSKYEGIVSPAYFVCKLIGVDKEFFSVAIRSKAYVSFFARFSKGIRVDQWDLSPIALKTIPFLLPPLAEQKEIVAYVEKKVAEIDAAVKGLEEEVAALKEYKQRLISDVVTGQVKV